MVGGDRLVFRTVKWTTYRLHSEEYQRKELEMISYSSLNQESFLKN